MKIVNTGRGIHHREIPGIDRLKSLPNRWTAYTNLDLPLSRGMREIDVIMVVDDRILLIDLKDWRGKIESKDGHWYQNNQYRARSPVAKIAENARDVAVLLTSHLRSEDRRFDRKENLVPRVKGMVVLTGTTDVSGIATTERGQVLLIDEFIQKILSPKDRVAALGPVPPTFVDNPLTSQEWKTRLDRFFNVQTGPFRPGTRRYGGYRAISDEPSFRHPTQIFEEFDVQDEQAAQATGILRRWDFSKADTRFQTEEARAEIAGRERAVVAWLNDRNTECESSLLQPKVDDPDKGVGYWEIFEKRRRLERLRDFIRSDAGRLNREDRLELARQILVRVKVLHDLDTAHLDLGIHSVWMESPSIVRLSHLMAASFPQIQSLGEHRFQFLSSATVPEQVLGNSDGPKKKDIFLLGCVIHYLLFGELPPCHQDGEPPEWKSERDKDEAYLELHPWFEKALAWDPRERFSHAGVMLEAFNRALPTRSSSKEVIEGLERFRTLRSQLQLIKEFPCKEELRDDDRVSMWTSEREGEKQFVKLWKRSAWGDQTKEAPRLLDFLERAENFIQSPIPGCVRIFRAVWLGDALVLIQEYVEAPNLAESLISDDSWSEPANAFTFLQMLIELTMDLHERGVAHGDLKPQNILVVGAGDGWQPVLIDTLDFAPADDGEIRSTAYTPEVGGRFERDRFAVTRITEEILNKCSLCQDELRPLFMAIQTCRLGPPANATLLPLLESIREATAPKPSVERYALSLSMTGAEVGSLLPDEGVFGLRRAPDRPKLFIRGAQEEIEIDFDIEGRPTRGRRRALEQKQIRNLTRYEFASIGADVEIVSGNLNDFSDVVALFRDPKVAAGWKAAGARDGITAGTVVDDFEEEEVAADLLVEEAGEALADTEEGEAPIASGINVPRLWRHLIDIESDLTIGGIALGDSSFRPDKKRHVLPFKLDSGAFDFGRDDRVLVESVDRRGRVRRIGYLDLSASTPEQIVIDVRQNLHSGPLVPEDQRLRFQSHFETTSRSRRKDATSRILTGRSVCPRLLDVFDPRSGYQPSAGRIDLDAAILKNRYGLNDVQANVMVDLLAYRPVGLLQGPPGTGKTKFIGALVHIALTHGLARNVLLASQSHEAVNNAAESVLKLFDTQETLPSILRVGHEGAVSDRLLPYHVARLEMLFKDRFRAELRERLRVAGQALGLEAELTERVIEIETTVFPIAEKLRILSTEPDGEVPNLIAGIKSTLQHQAEKLGLMLNDDIEEGRDFVQDLINQVAGQYQGRDRVARLRSVARLARDVMGSVSTRQRSFENFLAGTRQIVAGTCVGLGRSSLGLTSTPFDLVIIDEAARCTASELAVPIQAGRWIVLVGDQEQLEPMHSDEVLKNVSQETLISEREIKKSDFARVFESPYGRRAGRQLTKQYRMLPPIGDVVSTAFYGGILSHGRDTPVIDASALPEELARPLVWVATDSLGVAGQQQTEASGGSSLHNPAEADAIIALLKKWDSHEPFRMWLMGQHQFAKPIGIICTYGAQMAQIHRKLRVAGLSEVLSRAVNVDTVDGYQGKENPIVILSLVRNNYDGKVERGAATIHQGFMVRSNRINVAASRAMDRLVIVGARTRWPSGGPMAHICEGFSRQLAQGSAMVIDASQVDLSVGGRSPVAAKRHKPLEFIPEGAS